MYESFGFYVARLHQFKFVQEQNQKKIFYCTVACTKVYSISPHKPNQRPSKQYVESLHAGYFNALQYNPVPI